MNTNNSSFHADLLQNPDLLARLADAYGKTEIPLAPIVTSSPNVHGSAALVSPAHRKAALKAKKLPEAPILPELPQKGSIDALQFLALLRIAGMRPSAANPKVMVRDDIAARQDQRSAIAAFIGFDWQEPLGTQLDRATDKATYLIKKAAQKPEEQSEVFEHRSPMAHVLKWSVAGFVAGLPNAISKLLGDLAARERLAVDEATMFSNMIDAIDQQDSALFFKLVASLEKSNPTLVSALRQEKQVRRMLSQLHALSVVRLENIREDIAGLDGEHPTPEQIQRAHACMMKRGATSIEQDLVLLGDTPKS